MDIPSYIIEDEILWRVSSVKDLLVFRSVCKSWKTLIDSDNFKKKHFQASKQPSTSSIILMWRQETLGDEPTLHQMILYPQSNNNNNNNNNNIITELPVNNLGQFLGHRHRLVFKKFGTVNGLVCLGFNSFYVVWNPSTREYKRFNPPPSDLSFDIYNSGLTPEHFITAFGFDTVSQDYKFLMVAFASSLILFINNKTLVYYHLYSLKNNSWKMGVVELPFLSQIAAGDGYTDDGKFYWFVKHCGSDNIFRPALILFDFSTELFHLMLLEAQEFANIHEAVAVGNFGYLEMLMTFIHRKDKDEDEDLQCQVWRMQNDGSWTRRFAVIFPKVIGKPIGISKEGKLMFASLVSEDEFKGLLLINPNTHSCSIVRFNAFQLRVFNFVESLFSVNL